LGKTRNQNEPCWFSPEHNSGAPEKQSSSDCLFACSFSKHYSAVLGTQRSPSLSQGSTDQPIDAILPPEEKVAEKHQSVRSPLTAGCSCVYSFQQNISKYQAINEHQQVDLGANIVAMSDGISFSCSLQKVYEGVAQMVLLFLAGWNSHIHGSCEIETANSTVRQRQLDD
jgi:hypothetical protein